LLKLFVSNKKSKKKNYTTYNVCWLIIQSAISNLCISVATGYHALSPGTWKVN